MQDVPRVIKVINLIEDQGKLFIITITMTISVILLFVLSVDLMFLKWLFEMNT